MKIGQRLLGWSLGLMIGISLLTVSVLAVMDAAAASVAGEAPVLHASDDTTSATPTPEPTPTVTASTSSTTTSTPAPTHTPTPTPVPTEISGECGDGLVWKLTGSGLLVISGVGAMDNYAACEAPWYGYLTEIRAVEIGEGVTYIGANAFCDCVQLTEVTLPSTMSAIGDGAFDYCNELTLVYFTGAEEQWSCLDTGADNDCFESAVVINLYSDVNGDGMTDARDITRLMLCILDTAEPCGPAAGDYNDDDIVDILDVICLLRRLADDSTVLA